MGGSELLRRAYMIEPLSDVIMVFGDTNDYGHGDASFGNISDNTRETFCSAVDCLMSFLSRRYPQSKIVFMIPMRRCCDEHPSCDSRKTDARPLRDYVDVIKQKAKEHNVFVIDLYNGFNLNPDIESDKIKYIPDGLHPNDEGLNYLQNLLLRSLKN